MHRRQITYIVLFSVIGGGFLLFFLLAFFIPSAEGLKNMAGIFFLALLPALFVRVVSVLPQTIAGNIFLQLKAKKREEREEKLQVYCSANMLASEGFEALLAREEFSKVTRIFKDRKSSEKGKRVYQVTLKDYSRFRVTVVRKQPENDLHYTTFYVVDAVEPIKK